MISIGVDVSKGKSMVCIMKPGGRILKSPFEIPHSTESLIKLVELINSYEEEVRVVLENTGHYHLPVVAFLVENGIFTTCVNALRMKKFCSQSIRRAKTDRIDSVHIAQFGITYWNELTPITLSNNVYQELRLLSRQYHKCISMLVKAKVNLNTLLDQTMPGIKMLMSDSSSNHKLTDFVKRYYHYDHILEMGERRFVSDYCKVAKKQGYRMYEHLANEIFAMAQSGIPVLPNTDITKFVVLEAVRILREIEVTLDTIISQMQELAKTLPEFYVVREMAGIGNVLAPRIIAEIGDIRRFKNKHSLVAYAGIDAPPYQSGKFNAAERHISKRGNSYLRKIGYEIMQSKIKHKIEGDPVYDFICKKRLEGKSGKEAMIAGLNKFLRVYYGKVIKIYEGQLTISD